MDCGYYLGNFAVSIIGAFGLIGNILSILVFFKSSMLKTSTSTILLFGLAIFDVIYIFGEFIPIIWPKLNPRILVRTKYYDWIDFAFFSTLATMGTLHLIFKYSFWEVIPS